MKRIVLALVIVFTISCASRKVNTKTNETVKDSIAEMAVSIKDTIAEKTTVVEDIKVFTDISEITITPIDGTKTVMVNGTEYKNAIISIKKTKASTLHSINKIASKNGSKQSAEHNKTKVSTNIKTKDKSIDKEVNWYNYLWLILIPIIMALYKKVKDVMFPLL